MVEWLGAGEKDKASENILEVGGFGFISNETKFQKWVNGTNLAEIQTVWLNSVVDQTETKD